MSEHLFSPGRLRVLGATLVSGHDFSNRGEGQLILNQTAAQVMFRNENPINRPVTLVLPARFGLQARSVTKTIVRVIADMREPGYGKSVLPGLYESLLASGSADIPLSSSLTQRFLPKPYARCSFNAHHLWS